MQAVALREEAPLAAAMVKSTSPRLSPSGASPLRRVAQSIAAHLKNGVWGLRRPLVESLRLSSSCGGSGGAPLSGGSPP